MTAKQMPKKKPAPKSVAVATRAVAAPALRVHDAPGHAPAEQTMHVEMMPILSVRAYGKNPRIIPDSAVAKVASSLKEFGWRQPLVVDEQMTVIVGHTRLMAASKLGMQFVPVHVARGLTKAQVRAYRLADNRVAQESSWEMSILGEEMVDLRLDDFDLSLTGFDGPEIDDFFPEDVSALGDDDADLTPPAVPTTKRGDIYQLGRHRLMCGDCREFADVERLLAGATINVAVTSPPYASQREYDPTSGFRPIPPDHYVEWYRDVAANITSHLADDGSYFCNIKEHADDGQRDLYVTDLLISHVRAWGWRWVDTFCWRKLDNGVPGGWPNRFKDAWEPVYHYAKQQRIKFHALANGIESDGVFAYSPENAKSRTGSGLLRAPAEGRHEGMARPSNVIELTSSSESFHSAAYPVGLPAWFIRSFCDAGDVVFDPFMGSGTTLIAAEKENRIGYGMEISPAYCDVIIRRWEKVTGDTAVRL